MNDNFFKPLEKNKEDRSLLGRNKKAVNKIVREINKAYGRPVAVQVDNANCISRIVIDLRSMTQFRVYGLFYIDMYETGRVIVVREARELLTWDCSCLNTFELINLVTIVLEMLFTQGVSLVKLEGICSRNRNHLILRGDGCRAFVYPKVLVLAVKYNMLNVANAVLDKNNNFIGSDIDVLYSYPVSDRWV